MTFPIGQKVRLTEACPWPERVGCTATVVAAPSDGSYPQPSPREVVVLVDDDPLQSVNTHPWWTCVMAASACVVIDD